MTKPCHDKGGEYHISNSLYNIPTCNIIKQNAITNLKTKLRH